MKIYLAGPCDTENRYNMVQIAKIFREYGKHEVYCPWELKIKNAWDMPQEDWAQIVFEADIKAIQECDVFFMISQGRRSTAGTNWENGYAYALNKRIIILQITDEPASLMTYCSANEFFVCNKNKDTYYNMLQFIADTLETRSKKTRCQTVLT